ncbi:MAG: long-chain-fatty-acid--CoA ligase [SAR324 cluster bacterium]|nr:long-chain-fatty-acid--CoA ligase [SAR324 cluster bacterium]
MKMIKGCPSTSMDDYQLNHTTLIRHAARNFPEREVVYKTAKGVERYNYQEAYHRIKRLASALEQLGVQPGDRVGVLDWNSRRFFESYFAIPGIGAVLLQLNLRVSPDELAYVCNHSEAKYLFVDESLLGLAEELAPKLNKVSAFVLMTDKKPEELKTSLSPVFHYEPMIQSSSADYEWPILDETSAYSACYTSGTTGRPKGVYYSHRCIYIHAMMYAIYGSISCRDSLVQLVPMFHAQGWGIWQSAVFMGAKIVLPGRYSLEDTQSIIELMTDEKMTLTNGSPALFTPFLNHIKQMEEKPDFEGARIICGATEPPLSTMKGWRDLTGAEFIHIYGATETTPICLCNVLSPDLEERLSDDEKWELMKKQGIPVTGLDVKLVDENGKEVPRDGKTAGEIMVKGPWITNSYYNDERSQESFADGYWKSADAGTIDENGYVKIVDRYKDLIKSGGEWISSVDLENAIAAHPAVEEATVIGLKHPKWEERPLALVVKMQGEPQSNVTEQDIIDFIAPKFARWQLPDKIKFVQTIRKTSVGKFDKKKIRNEYANEFIKP